MVALPPAMQRTALADGPTDKTIPAAVPAVVRQGVAHVDGAHNPSDIISIAVGLPLRNKTGLDAYLRSVADPTSPQYHHYLSQDEANRQFNPTAEDEQRVVAWLMAHGLLVTRRYPNHLMVDATGTIARIQSMLAMTVQDYTAKQGTQTVHFYAPDAAPTVDASVSDVVATVAGLDNYPRFHTGSNGLAHGTTPYYPQDFANAYNVNPLWNAGATGQGQHVGITMWAPPPSDQR